MFLTLKFHEYSFDKESYLVNFAFNEGYSHSVLTNSGADGTITVPS